MECRCEQQQREHRAKSEDRSGEHQGNDDRDKQRGRDDFAPDINTEASESRGEMEFVDEPVFAALWADTDTIIKGTLVLAVDTNDLAWIVERGFDHSSMVAGSLPLNRHRRFV